MRIYLISRPEFDIESINSFLEDVNTTWDRGENSTNPETIVELAGRICYMSFGDKQRTKGRAFIKSLIAKGHESVLEHANWSFIITGVTRSFSHQLVRHRIGFSFSQLSQQYMDHAKGSFIAPKLLSKAPDAKATWENSIRGISTAYEDLIKILDNQSLRKELSFNSKEFKRAIRSAARSMLPNASETKIFFTANARSLRHFLKIRGAIEGDFEMSEFAVALFRILIKEAPSLFDDFEVKKLDDGCYIVVKKSVSQT